MGLDFAVTWDYRCPFARNANEQILTGLAAGAPWTVTFLPFSLGQAHVGEGQPDVWDNPDQDSGILALQAGVVVHDEAKRLWDRAEVGRVLNANGAPADEVFALIDSGDALARVVQTHPSAALTQLAGCEPCPMDIPR